MIYTKILKASACALLVLAGTAHAQSNPIDMSEDEKLGCTILMCLSNPSGPKAEPKCQEPINELNKRMAKFWKRPVMPKCTSVEGQGTKYELSQAKYPACPAGYDALDSGALAYITSKEGAEALVEASKIGMVNQIPAVDGKFVVGIGEGDEITTTRSSEGSDQAPDKVCVQNMMGRFTFTDEGTEKTSWLFEKVTLIPPPSSALKFKVYINGQLYKEGDLN